jgi:16S rRNA (uracil1498-N3)-methyltransferase
MGLYPVSTRQLMRRFFLPDFSVDTTFVDLSPEVAHHVKTVLRLREGSDVVICDGAGQCFECRLEDLSKGCRVEVRRQWHEEESALSVTLIQGLPHSDKFDLILQKTTELGVGRICPVVCERCQYPIAPAKRERKQQRWLKIATEAARQSERAWLPEVAELTPFSTAIQNCDAELKLVLWEEAQQPLKDILPPSAPFDVAVVVGPEGGLTAAEVALAVEHGFVVAGLGPRILRTETAGLTLMAVLQYVYGDLNLPPRGQNP